MDSVVGQQTDHFFCLLHKYFYFIILTIKSLEILPNASQYLLFQSKVLTFT